VASAKGFFGKLAARGGWNGALAQPAGWFGEVLIDGVVALDVRVSWVQLEVPAASGGATIKYWTGGAPAAEPLRRWNGSAWVSATLKRWNGSAWVTV